jgi:predicted HTH transcriptional regulator
MVMHRQISAAEKLKDLVKRGEGLYLEFKLKTNHPEKIIKEIVAFANTNGGKLLIGISDDKELVGLKYDDEDEFIITRAIEKHIYPAIDYSIEKVKLENQRTVLIYNIMASPMKPHYVDLTIKAEDRKAYVRVDDKSIQASKELREILKAQNKDKSYKFNFGDKEKALMQQIDLNGHITLNSFVEIAHIDRKNASRTLILMVLAGVLKILPRELEDLFVLAK